MDNLEYKTCIGRPKYLCRWWLKTRKVKPTFAGDAVNELYCPTWAKPLDFVYSLVFGNCKLKLTKE